MGRLLPKHSSSIRAWLCGSGAARLALPRYGERHIVPDLLGESFPSGPEQKPVAEPDPFERGAIGPFAVERSEAGHARAARAVRGGSCSKRL
jgi:hypothetical protein